MNRRLVGALEPLGQDVLLQLQEELVPERERKRKTRSLEERISRKRRSVVRMYGMESVESIEARTRERHPPRSLDSFWLAPGGSENEPRNREGREGRRKIFK